MVIDDDISAHVLKETALSITSVVTQLFIISHLNLEFQMNGRLPMSHPFQNHTISSIQEAIAHYLIALCVEQTSVKECEKPTG